MSVTTQCRPTEKALEAFAAMFPVLANGFTKELQLVHETTSANPMLNSSPKSRNSRAARRSIE